MVPPLNITNCQGRGSWCHLVLEKKCKANLNVCGSLIVAILSGSEFQSFKALLLRSRERRKNCLKISDGQG